MEGAVHIQGAHRKLFYKRFYRGEIVNSLNQEGVIETGETQRIEFRINDLTTEPNPQTSIYSNGWRIFKWRWILDKSFIY